MRVKTYEIEVVRTATVRVTLPETMATDETIKSWERGLWKLDNREADIATYAARMAVEFPDSDHDGIGHLITSAWEKPDYGKQEHQIVAVVLDEESEETINTTSEWMDSATVNADAGGRT